MGSSQHDIDVQLGKLAIAMEKRVHGGVSMDVATGANNRSPLDRRSLWERLATVSPADGTLPIDANADAELLHVTANNGLCRPSPHSQIPKEMEEELQSQLRQALDHGSPIRLSDGVPGPVTGRDAWVWTAVEASGGLFAVVYREAGESPTPSAAFAAGTGKRGFLSWEAVWQSGPPPNNAWPKPPLWETEGPQDVPTGRWLVSRLLPALLPIGESAYWLVAFPRCLAWAWFLLDRPARPAQLTIEAESPTVIRWSRAIARSLERPGCAVEVEPGGWCLTAFSEASSAGEPCLAFGLWAPGVFKPNEGASAMLMICAVEDGVRIDRPPDRSGFARHPDLDDYVESVLVAAVGIYWREHDLLLGG